LKKLFSVSEEESERKKREVEITGSKGEKRKAGKIGRKGEQENRRIGE
jgi:hypothetical protein